MRKQFWLFGVVVIAAAAFAAVRTEFPSAKDPGPPYYARLQLGAVIRDGNTVAIPFYRDPACVPPDFNLLNLFDAPRAFSCGLTVEGFDIWKNGPFPIDQAPTHSETRGLGAVPIWFVDRSEFVQARADAIVTIVELAALPSLRVGYAHVYEETLHPDEAAQVPTKNIVALGTLLDGTPFQVHVTTGPGEGQVNISFH